MADLREIFLQPACCADEHTGRLWCEDDAPVDCEDEGGNEVPWTRYIRADLYDELIAERALLVTRAENAEAALTEAGYALDLLRKYSPSLYEDIVKEAIAHLSRKGESHE